MQRFSKIVLAFVLAWSMSIPSTALAEPAVSNGIGADEGGSTELDELASPDRAPIALSEEASQLLSEIKRTEISPFDEGTDEDARFSEESAEKARALSFAKDEDWTSLEPDDDYVDRKVVVGFRFDASEADMLAVLSDNGLELDLVVAWDDAEDGAGKAVCATIVSQDTVHECMFALYQNENVLYAEPSWLSEPIPEDAQGIDPDPMTYVEYSNSDSPKPQWSLDSINAPSAWNLRKCDRKVSVAVLDTGIDLDHPDLKKNIDFNHAWSFVDEKGNATGEPVKLDGDIASHGTEVAGVIAADATNGIGVKGVSHDCSIVPIRIAYYNDQKAVRGLSVAMARAINYLVDHPIEGLRVINLSYGVVSGSRGNVFWSAVQNARKKGIVVVVAAGNEGVETIDYDYTSKHEVIAVGAIGRNEKRTNFTNWGRNTDVVAPGDWMWMPTNRSLHKGSYVQWRGTSFAAPVAAGVLALMFAEKPDLSAAAAEAVLKKTAVKVDGKTGFSSEYGWGKVDAAAALRYLRNDGGSDSLSRASVTLPSRSYPYTGSQIKPKPTVTLDGSVLVEGRDYSVSYNNNLLARSNAEVFVEGRDKYGGSAMAEFYISSKWARLLGMDAFGTMRDIVYQGFPGKRSNLVVTTAGGYWDALTASSLAGIKDCPVVLTDKNQLSSEARSAIISLEPKSVYILGGTAAVSSSVEKEIKRISKVNVVSRLQGDSAITTGIAVYEEGKKEGKWGKTAVIATLDSFQDAMSISPYSFKSAAPIFLTLPGGELGSDVVSAIRSGGFKNVVICGGTAAVSGNTESKLPGIHCIRLSGDDCYGTSLRIARWCQTQGMVANRMAVATGEGYHDGMCGGPLCGKFGSVLLLASEDHCEIIDGFVKPNKQSIKEGYILGGKAALSDNIEKRLNDALL